MVFGWLTDGEGVWVFRYGNERAVPRDFERISLALDALGLLFRRPETTPNPIIWGPPSPSGLDSNICL